MSPQDDKPQKATAISFGGHGSKFINEGRLVIKNFDVGISGSEGSSIEASNIEFDNVGLPFDMPRHGPSSLRNTKIRNDPKAVSNRSSIGTWVGSGPALPAFCPHCKLIFPSKNYKFSGTYFNAWDNEETCPECRNEHAYLSEGIFDLSAEAVRILTAPDITYAMLGAISKVAIETLRHPNIDPDHPIQKFGAVNTKLASFLRKSLEQSKSWFYYAVGAAGIISMMLGCQQVELAAEQTEIARRQLSDQTLEKVLETLEDIRANQSGVFKPNNLNKQQPSASPADTKPLVEGHPAGSRNNRKPKARYLRRMTDSLRRKDFQGCRSPTNR